jgi:hypothetical protein
MPAYGVCRSDENRCGLSYQTDAFSRLLELMRVIGERRLRGGNHAELMPQLDQYLHYFQNGEFCGDCGGGLTKVMQPTAALRADSEEYRTTSRANAVLEAKDRLIALRKLQLEE